jgi:hypothetical protein
MTGGGGGGPAPTQFPFLSRTSPGPQGGGGGTTGAHAPLESRNSPLPQAGCRVMHDFPSSPMFRLLQQLPSGIRV